MTELLPCPFCGGNASFEHLENTRWSIGCADIDGDCMGFQSLQTFSRKAEALAAWNRRPTSAGQSEEVDRIAWHKPAHRAVMASVHLGKWMSAALDDPDVCEDMKADIREWFSAGEPVGILSQALSTLDLPAVQREARALVVLERFANLKDLVVVNDQPDRVRYKGEWYEWPMATAFIELVKEVSAVSEETIRAGTGE